MNHHYHYSDLLHTLLNLPQWWKIFVFHFTTIDAENGTVVAQRVNFVKILQRVIKKFGKNFHQSLNILTSVTMNVHAWAKFTLHLCFAFLSFRFVAICTDLLSFLSAYIFWPKWRKIVPALHEITIFNSAVGFRHYMNRLASCYAVWLVLSQSWSWIFLRWT